MAVLICKMCGGNLEITEGMTTAKCPYCGTTQTLPKLDDEKRLRLYDRANHFRRSNDYDKAMAVYEQILSEDQTDSEAYWSIVLCRYGIEYVEDPNSHQRVPTINRTQYTSVLADEDYKAALQYADVVQRQIYEKEAAAIDSIQKGIWQISRKEEHYDIFICYKETGEDGNRTKESVLADEIYYILTREGYRVFCARITLEDKLGMAYEPYIFAAINSARVMVVLGTSPENFQAVWVRNEWSRYLSLIRQGEKKVLIPAYRDMDPYDLPKEFSHLQALDMSRIGFSQDLLHGIRKILRESPAVTRESIVPEQVRGIEYQAVEVKTRKTGWEPYGWKRGILVAILLVAAILLLNAAAIYNRWKKDHGEKIQDPAVTEEGASGITDVTDSDAVIEDYFWDLQETDKTQVREFSGVLEQFVSAVYQCPAKEVSDAQLARMKQLYIKRDWEEWQIGYSSESPSWEQGGLTDAEDGLTWMVFSGDAELRLGSLPRFTNLQKLDVDTAVTAENIQGLSLESISAYFDSPVEAASVIKHPENIRELGFNSGAESLEGLQAFENLETLSIDYSELDTIDQMVNAKKLKKLTLIADASLEDFTVLGKLTDLEWLELEATGLRSLNFAQNLQNLKGIEVRDAEIRSLAGLENCTSLRSLSVTDCIELKDLSLVQEFTDLEELTLDVPYQCPDPELGGLKNLKKLTLEQYEDCSFLQDMTGLTQLHLSGCTFPENMDFSKLTSLRDFSYTYTTGVAMDVAVVESIQSLERLSLNGVTTYHDISGLFAMPKLKELDISGMECEIDFDAVRENTTLEILHMDDMILFENAWESSPMPGYITAGWDDVELEENIDFLTRFTGLRELYLAGNGLTDISFAGQMPTLEVLDISENYITQLRPLMGLPSLKKVICADNPLTDKNVLGDSVVIDDTPDDDWYN